MEMKLNEYMDAWTAAQNLLSLLNNINPCWGHFIHNAHDISRSYTESSVENIQHMTDFQNNKCGLWRSVMKENNLLLLSLACRQHDSADAGASLHFKKQLNCAAHQGLFVKSRTEVELVVISTGTICSNLLKTQWNVLMSTVFL